MLIVQLSKKDDDSSETRSKQIFVDLNIPSLTELFSVAFHAVVSTRYPIINDRDKVKFDTSKLNTGNG